MKQALLRFLLYLRGHERIGVDLPVRVMKCYADGLALILKDKNIFNEFKRAELLKPVPPYFDQFI